MSLMGGTAFKTTSKPQIYADFIGSACTDCGHNVTDEDIKRQASDIAIQRMKDALNRKR